MLVDFLPSRLRRPSPAPPPAPSPVAPAWAAAFGYLGSFRFHPVPGTVVADLALAQVLTLPGRVLGTTAFADAFDAPEAVASALSQPSGGVALVVGCAAPHAAPARVRFVGAWTGDGSLDVAVFDARVFERAAPECAAPAAAPRLDAVLEALPVGVVVSDAHGRLLHFNETANRIIGRDACPDVTSIEDYARYTGRWVDTGEPVGTHEWALARVLATGVPVSGDLVEVDRPDGSTVVLLNSCSPLFDACGVLTGAVVAFADVTGQQRAERALRERTAEVARIDAALDARVEARTADLAALNDALEARNRELRDFAGVVSHDMQEPLRKLTLFADLLVTEKGTLLDDEGRHYAERIDTTARRLSALVRDLLAYTHAGHAPYPLQPVDLHGETHRVLEELDLLVRERQATVETALDGLPPVRAHARAVHQIVLNLVRNALTHHREGERPVVAVTGHVDGPWLRLRVQDNGVGFPDEAVERMFTPFKRLDGRRTPGTGLGLPIVQRAAERCGGRVEACGSDGTGGRFDVFLPLWTEEGPAQTGALVR